MYINVFDNISLGAQAIVVAFDLTNPHSLTSTEIWLMDALKVLNYDDETPLIFLVGTKKDLLVSSDVFKSSSELEIHSMAIEMASRLNAEYWPVSSLTG